ncbi:MAG: hypothetical protein WBG86_00660 [Polyangiales bacterium]
MNTLLDVARITLLAGIAIGCGRIDSPPVAIAPGPDVMLPDVPTDPFGTPGKTYDQLLLITETARKTPWDGEVEHLAAWLEAQTVAVERSRAFLIGLAVGAEDVFAVANGRLALLYEHIASTLTDAEAVITDPDVDFDWMGKQMLLWEQANGYWSRCAVGCSLGGPYLDVWELRCEAGAEETGARFRPPMPEPSPRQPE